jgi:hypothetical protein
MDVYDNINEPILKKLPESDAGDEEPNGAVGAVG